MSEQILRPTNNDIILADSPTPAVRDSGIPIPLLFQHAGPQARNRFLEFFTAHIRNRGTRTVYGTAVAQFANWCTRHGLALSQVTPIVVATYIEELTRLRSAPTVKLHLAAIRMLCDWLVVGQVLPVNPAASVRGPKHVVKKGKTPVLTAGEARRLLDSIDCSTLIGLRDRALIGVMVYSFARVSATVGMNVEDYYPQGRRMWLRFIEKGGKHHEVPAHHHVEAYVDAYLEGAGTIDDRRRPLFRTISRERTLTNRRLHRTDVLRMIKRRAKQAGLPTRICCHTFRATGITEYMRNGGTLEKPPSQCTSGRELFGLDRAGYTAGRDAAGVSGVVRRACAAGTAGAGAASAACLF